MSYGMVAGWAAGASPKTNLASGSMNLHEPSRSDSIDFGSCPGKPDLAPVIRDLQPVAGCGFLGRRFKRVGFLNQPFEVFPARTLKVIDSLNLLKTPFELLEMVRKRIRIRLASFLILDK